MGKAYRTGSKVGCLAAWLLFESISAAAQESIPGRMITCYGIPASLHVRTVGVPSWLRSEQSRSRFEVSFEAFPEAAKAAFQYAIGIWQPFLASPVPIRVKTSWTSLPGMALASTGATQLYRNFPRAPHRDVWYPVALAEKLEEKELNAGADMVLSLNRDIDWYFGTDGHTPAGQMDLVTVVLHEIAHGLGFISSAAVQDGKGTLGERHYPLVYDGLLENGQHVLLTQFTNASEELYEQLTSDQVYLNSPAATVWNKGLAPQVYAPRAFTPHSSLSHLDELAFPPGDPNSLMTASFNRSESIHVPDNILLGILDDLGWQIETNKGDYLTIYPNPGKGPFYFHTNQIPEGDEVRISVVTAAGKEVRAVTPFTYHQGRNQIHLSGLSAGLYVLIIHTRQNRFVRKVCLAP
jgi:hypothetical protein